MRPSAKGLTFLHLIPPWLLASLFWPPTDEASKQPNIIPDTFLWKPLAGITHSKWMCACNLCFQTLFLSLGPSPRELLWPAPSCPPIHCSLFRHSATRPALLITHQTPSDVWWTHSEMYLYVYLHIWKEEPYERTDFFPSPLKWAC